MESLFKVKPLLVLYLLNVLIYRKTSKIKLIKIVPHIYSFVKLTR